MNQSDVVILTGGLGPTKDDITKRPSPSSSAPGSYAIKPVADHVRRMLEARGIEYTA